jgi:hypothetical protein
MWSGFSSTSEWSAAEPMADTIPCPTRAMIVSSVAPPTSCLMFVFTVTRALTLSWMPFFATASIVGRPRAALGTSITFGFTLVCTASRMSRPARSIAVAVLHGRSMLALFAAIIALITRTTSPPASTWLSISGVLISSPARTA